MCQELADGRLQRQIESNLPQHIDYERSFETLSRELPAAIRGDLIIHTLKRSGEAAGSAPRLTRLLAERRWEEQLSRSVAECLRGSLERVRDNLASQQVIRRFPNLRARLLPEKTILKYRESPNDSASQMIRAVGISVASVPEPLLQETQAKLGNEASDLLQEGVNAMDQQLSLAESSRAEIDRLRQAGHSRPEILQQTRSKLLTNWRELQQPNNIGAWKYRELFRHTEDRLADLVDNAFKQPIIEPVPIASVQSHGPSDDEPGDGGGGNGQGGSQEEGQGAGSRGGNGGGGGCTEPQPGEKIAGREEVHDWRKEAALGSILCLASFMVGLSVRR